MLIRKKYILVLTIILLIILVVVAIANFTKENKACMAETNADRVKFLEDYGWQIKSEPIETENVSIPSDFNAVWIEYNKIQKEAGFDLEKFRGKQAVRYTYEVLNHKNVSGRQVRANILVCDGQIIGGDIMTTAIDGFMHALNKKE